MKPDTQIAPGSETTPTTFAEAQGGELRHSLSGFRWAIRLVLLGALVVAVYWLLLASDRFVSEGTVIIQKTDLTSGASFDLSMLVSGSSSLNRPDQLLLREYLLSLDMLKKLDAALDLRAHYSDRRRDLISRMWFKDASMEWFHRYYCSRVSITFDDYAGVLRIEAQAYDPQTAQAIANMLLQEGERYMNELGHQLAEAQVSFLTTQVAMAQGRLQLANNTLLNFQNQKGLVSPQGTAENISAIIAKLEAQKSELQTKLATLPTTLAPDHPNILMLKQALAAVDRQIAQERTKLAAPSGKPLNATVEEFQRLQMAATFAQDIYKTALVALEHGRMEATRTLKKVSILQAPSQPEYPMEPRRIYNTAVTLLFAVLLAGILKLLESIVLDHID